MMKIYEYESLLPHYLFVVDARDENIFELLNHFRFKKNDGVFLEDIDTVTMQNELEMTSNCADGVVYPVSKIRNGRRGCLVLILDDGFDTEKIAHESVHAADYFYQVAGANSEDFSDGNEMYAYTVGWIAGKIANVLIKNNKDGKTK